MSRPESLCVPGRSRLRTADQGFHARHHRKKPAGRSRAKITSCRRRWAFASDRAPKATISRRHCTKLDPASGGKLTGNAYLVISRPTRARSRVLGSFDRIQRYLRRRDESPTPLASNRPLSRQPTQKQKPSPEVTAFFEEPSLYPQSLTANRPAAPTPRHAIPLSYANKPTHLRKAPGRQPRQCRSLHWTAHRRGQGPLCAKLPQARVRRL